jgi:hypothetical protein
MSTWLVVIVTILYLGTAVACMYEGKPWFFLVFFGYSIANVGFIWSLYK